MPVSFQSRMFGALDVADEQLLAMPDGVIGFPRCTSFALLPAGREGFSWLQSVQEPAVAFLIIDPFLYFEDYAVDLAGPVLQRLGTTEPSQVNVLAIVTLAGSTTSATANLQGPLVFNVQTRTGFQAVIQDGGFGTREPVPHAPLVSR